MPIVIAYERRWIAGPIPALGGLTPRQALNDPARRVDLDDLLDDIRDRHGADSGLMSIDRIEALLGIQATGKRLRGATAVCVTAHRDLPKVLTSPVTRPALGVAHERHSVARDDDCLVRTVRG